MLYYSNRVYQYCYYIYIFFILYIYIKKTEIVFFVVLIWINFFIPISASSFVNVIPH